MKNNEKPVDVTKLTKKSRFRSALFIQAVIINLVNIFVLMGIVYLFIQIPKKAQVLRDTRTMQQLESEKTDAIVLKADLDKHRDKINDLENSIINEANLVRFFEYRDQIMKDPAVTRFEISDKTIADRNKNSGYGVTLEVNGGLDKLSEHYVKIQSVPFLIHPLMVDIEKTEEGSFRLTYFGILFL